MGIFGASRLKKPNVYNSLLPADKCSIHSLCKTEGQTDVGPKYSVVAI